MRLVFARLAAFFVCMVVSVSASAAKIVNVEGPILTGSGKRVFHLTIESGEAVRFNQTGGVLESSLRPGELYVSGYSAELANANELREAGIVASGGERLVNVSIEGAELSDLPPGYAGSLGYAHAWSSESRDAPWQLTGLAVDVSLKCLASDCTREELKLTVQSIRLPQSLEVELVLGPDPTRSSPPDVISPGLGGGFCPQGYRIGSYPDNPEYCYYQVPAAVVSPGVNSGCPSGYLFGSYPNNPGNCYYQVPAAVVSPGIHSGCPSGYLSGSYPNNPENCYYQAPPPVVSPGPVGGG